MRVAVHNTCVDEDPVQRLATARERVRELTSHLRKDTMQAWREALVDQLPGAERSRQGHRVLVAAFWRTSGARNGQGPSLMMRNGPLTCVGVAGFEPAASSSRTMERSVGRTYGTAPEQALYLPAHPRICQRNHRS
jgi:hypothetical protein